MAAPVWVLSVDLQTKTATFQTGMAEAAKSARGAFSEIKTSAHESGKGVSESVFSVQTSLGLLDNVIRGNHAGAMADLLNEFSKTSLVMAAIPFAAVIGGIGALIGIAVEAYAAIKEWREEQERLSLASLKFGTTLNEALRSVDDQLLQAGIRTDELRNDHLGALHKQLLLIDHQSMAELVKQLELVAKAADETFQGLQSSWYKVGIGSAGASHALTQFKAQYESLLGQNKDKDASDLLRGTRESAERVLAAQQRIKEFNKGGFSLRAPEATQGDQDAANMLKKARVGYTEKEISAQEALVEILTKQMEIEGRLAETKNTNKDNATTATSKAAASLRAEAEREAAEHGQKMGEMGLAAQREQADAGLTLMNATVAERLAVDLRFADEQMRIQLTANGGLINALDKGGNDYNNQLKALRDKSVEITEQHTATITGLMSKASQDQYRQDIADMLQAERAKIEVTDQGSADRLAAIGAAIRSEQALNLQNTEHYRDLLTQRVQAQKDANQTAATLAAQTGKEEADDMGKMGELAIAAAREKQALMDSARRVTIAQQIAQEIQAADDIANVKRQAIQREASTLDKGAKDYSVKLKALQDKEKQLIQAHENDVTVIRDQAEKARNARILSAAQAFNSEIAQGLTQVIMGHETFANMMGSIGDRVVSGMLQTALMSMMTADMSQEREAAQAAREMFLAGAKLPFPANIVAAPAMGAAAFASMMAYEDGTDMVPGVGRGDSVPAILAPGEGVVPGGVMDGLRTMARSGGMAAGKTTHVHFRPTYNLQALDSEGMDRVLDKHGPKLQKHVERTLRKMNS